MTTEIENIASVLFNQYGARNVTVEDIAVRMNISKKTIYQKYQTKDNLVNIALKNQLREIKEAIDQICQKEGNNPVKCIVDIYAFAIKKLSATSQAFLHSIKKYFPAAHNTYQQFQDEMLSTTLIPLLSSAKQLGIIREDVDLDIIASLHKKHFDEIIGGNMYIGEKLNQEAFFRHIIINNIRGLLTKNYYHILDKDFDVAIK